MRTSREGVSPSALIFVKNLGISPNNGPVFDVRYPGSTSGVTFMNLEIVGYNQAMSFYDTEDNVFQNVSLSTSLSGPTGQPDNVPLVLSNLFDFEWDGGNCQASSSTNYCILMKGDTPLQTGPSEAPLVGLARFTNIQGEGGTFHYDQRVNTTGSGPGNIVFDNIRAWEAGEHSFLLRYE